MSSLSTTTRESVVEVVDDDRIRDLADRIREGHRDVRGRGRELILSAVEVGERILEARTVVPRGEWLRWLQDHCELSVQTAYSYEHLALGKEKLLDAWERHETVDSIAGALRFVKPGTTYGQPGKRSTPTLPPPRRVPIEDYMIEQGAAFLVQRFPRTFARMKPIKRRATSEELAAQFLAAALRRP